jgi:hypothetical protein
LLKLENVKEERASVNATVKTLLETLTRSGCTKLCTRARKPTPYLQAFTSGSETNGPDSSEALELRKPRNGALPAFTEEELSYMVSPGILKNKLTIFSSITVPVGYRLYPKERSLILLPLLM